MATRRMLIMLAVLPVVLSLAPACSETTRYRVLSFFFDGVPKPGSEAVADTGPTDSAPTAVSDGATPRARAIEMYAHPPYAQGRCGACHNPESGQLIKALDEGLCQMCHAKVAQERYVHGPVAVNACTFCHHYHTAPQPRILLKRVPELCLECHDKSDLTTGTHHETIESRSCVDCHNPHGGDDRFFLKRAES